MNAEVVEGLKRGVLLGAAAAAILLPPAGIATVRWSSGHAQATSVPLLPMAPTTASPNAHQPPRFADFGNVEPPVEVRRIADWAADSRDNGVLDFVILDKRGAHVYVFDREGRLVGDTPVLLGAAAGDDTVDGVGQKALHDVRPEERTTPAGRFVGESGRNVEGEDVFWVDYDAAVSMHRVRQLDASERRLERLATPTAADNRISYGCINMPVAFFDEVMVPSFRGRRGLVYVLPETRRLAEVFPGLYDVASRQGLDERPTAAVTERR